MTNGLFAVPEKEKQRLIMDSRRANSYFNELRPEVLPNPGDFVELNLEPDRREE